MSALLTDRGLSRADAALAVSAVGGAALIGRWITGWLLDRFFAPRVAAILLLISAVGAALLAVANSTLFGVLGASLIGFGMGGEADVTPWLLARYLGLRAFATLYAMTWTVYAIAGAIGPVIMGKAFDATGSYELLLTELAGLTAASAGLMFFMPRYPANFISGSRASAAATQSIEGRENQKRTTFRLRPDRTAIKTAIEEDRKRKALAGCGKSPKIVKKTPVSY